MKDRYSGEDPRDLPRQPPAVGAEALEDPPASERSTTARAEGCPDPRQLAEAQRPCPRSLADHLPDVIGRLDRELRYVFINRAIPGITGKSAGDHLGHTDEELGYPPALCRLWRRQYRTVLASGAPSELCFALESPRGVLHFSKCVLPERDADGSVRSLIFIARDVSAIKHAEQERGSRRRILAGINRIFDTLVTGDRDAAFAAACRGEAERLTGSPWSCLCALGADGLLHESTTPDSAASTDPHAGMQGLAALSTGTLAEGIRERVLCHGETLLIGDAPTTSGPSRPARADAAPTAFLGVPLKHRERVIGMIAVAGRAGGYGAAERDSLETLAPTIAEALALRETEAALAAAKRQAELDRNRLEAVLEASPAGVVLIKAATRRFLYLNRRALELYGVDYAGMDLAAHAAELHTRHPDGRPFPLAEWPVSRTLASGAVIHQQEMIMERADGRAFSALVSSAPVLDDRGALSSVVAVFDDISERKEAEAALRDSEERLRMALEGARFGTFDYFVQTDKMDWDDQLRRIWGVGPGETLSYADVIARVHPDDRPRVLDAVADAYDAQSGDDYQAEYRVIRPDGSWRWHDTRGRVEFERCADGSQRPVRVIGVVRDVTEHKTAEVALVALNRALEARVAEVSRQSDQLRALASQLSRVEQRERQRLAGILHDHLQQLLVAAQMQSSMLLREAPDERLRSAAGTVYDVLKEALSLSRSLTVELSPPVLQETGLIGGLDWLARRMREQHGFTVRVQADTGAEPASEELRFLLFECARELLLNVVKHAGADSADLVLARSHGGPLKLAVSDEGRGFDPAVVTRRRADETSFGLFSIKERLAHVGGRMSILSAPKRGTQVTLSVPAAGLRPRGADESAEPAAHVGELTLSPVPEIRRVLIADDHQILRQGLAGLFRIEADIDVVGEAATGDQAVAMAAELRPDVVVMDVHLGAGMDGIEATRRVRAGDPRIRVIGLSMDADDAVADAMRDAGAAAYLTKGGPCEDLLAAIRAEAPA